MAQPISKYLTDIMTSISDIPTHVRSVSDIGIDFSTIAGKNRKLLGKDESEQDEMYNMFIPKDIDYENIPYFNKQYKEKVKELKKLASYAEVEDVLDKICDETVVYDKHGKFCEIDVSTLTIKEEVKESIENSFNRIYSLLGWSDGISAWSKFREWSTNGFIAYEIIYEYEKKNDVDKVIRELETKGKRLNEQLTLTRSNYKKVFEGKDGSKDRKAKISKLREVKVIETKLQRINEEVIRKKSSIAIYEDMFRIPKDSKIEDKNLSGNLTTTDDGVETGNIPVRIKGFQEIEPETLIPIRIRVGVDQFINIWKQKKEHSNRYVSDNAIIFIAYNKVPGSSHRIAYVERLMRNFYLMRKMEDSRVAWNIMNSQYRMKMVIPVGNKTTAKAKQAIQEVANKHREELYIDEESGIIRVNGDPYVRYGKNIVLPRRQGQSPEVDSVSYNGPDLQRMDSVEYFRKNFYYDSKLPKSRTDREQGAGRFFVYDAGGIPYDEHVFYKYINRVRKEYENVLRKPTRIQAILDHPELKIDPELETKLGIVYESNNLFEDAKKTEIEDSKLRIISQQERLTRIDGRTPLYSKKFLYVHKYKLMTDEEWDINEQMVQEEQEELLKQQEREQNRGVDGRR